MPLVHNPSEFDSSISANSKNAADAVLHAQPADDVDAVAYGNAQYNTLYDYVDSFFEHTRIVPDLPF